MNDSFARVIDHFNAEEYREALLAFGERWSAERTEFLRGLIQLCSSPWVSVKVLLFNHICPGKSFMNGPNCAPEPTDVAVACF